MSASSLFPVTWDRAEADDRPSSLTVPRADVHSPAWIGRGLRLVATVWEFLLGTVFLIFALAALASVPVLQMLSLGYLLEVAGRVARNRRLRDGFIGIRPAARMATLSLGIAISWSPLLLLSHLGYIAFVVDSQSAAANNLHAALTLLTFLLLGHVIVAITAGGRLSHFLWPLWLPWLLLRLWKRNRRPLSHWFAPAVFVRTIREQGLYRRSRDRFWDFVVGLRLPYYFWLGLRGFLGTVLWLLIPVALLVAGIERPEGIGPLLGIAGGVLLVVVMLYAPFAQVRYASQRRLRCLFQISAVRQLFCRAPIAFLVALTATLVLATPLYLLKIEATPREITWIPSLVFVAFAFPARLLTGWAVSRAERHASPRHAVFRWAARLLIVPLIGAYVLIVFFTQYSSWHGTWSILEQHALLVPVPFLGQ
jgi:hypothetical protein